jgi:hypothetical protein
MRARKDLCYQVLFPVLRQYEDNTRYRTPFRNALSCYTVDSGLGPQTRHDLHLQQTPGREQPGYVLLPNEFFTSKLSAGKRMDSTLQSKS